MTDDRPPGDARASEVVAIDHRRTDALILERLKGLEDQLSEHGTAALNARLVAQEQLRAKDSERLERISARLEAVVKVASQPQSAAEAVVEEAKRLHDETLREAVGTRQAIEALGTKTAAYQESVERLAKALGHRGALHLTTVVLLAALVMGMGSLVAISWMSYEAAKETRAAPTLDLGKRN